MRTVSTTFFVKLGSFAAAAAFVSGYCAAPGVALADTVATIDGGGDAVNTRSGPGTDYALMGSLDHGSEITIVCTSYGESVSGTWGESSLWDKLDDGRYIADTYVYTGSDGPVEADCEDSPDDPPPDDPPPDDGHGGYPYWDMPPCTEDMSLEQCYETSVDPWAFFYRECTSFVAWKMNDLGVDFSNHMYGGTFSHARLWDDNVAAIDDDIDIYVDTTPAVHAIAQWEGAAWNHGYGHVAVVIDVDGDQITVAEYNFKVGHGYGTRVIAASNPDHYIHLAD